MHEITSAERRRLAAMAGEKRYEGKPCIRCGSTDRHTSNGACVACTVARANANSAKLRKVLREASDASDT